MYAADECKRDKNILYKINSQRSDCNYYAIMKIELTIWVCGCGCGCNKMASFQSFFCLGIFFFFKLVFYPLVFLVTFAYHKNRWILLGNKNRNIDETIRKSDGKKVESLFNDMMCFVFWRATRDEFRFFFFFFLVRKGMHYEKSSRCGTVGWKIYAMLCCCVIETEKGLECPDCCVLSKKKWGRN